MDTKRLILAGGLAVAAFVVFSQVKKMGTAPTVQAPSAPAVVVNQVEYLDVLVASMDIPFGTKVRPESLMWKPWPAEALSETFITSDIRPDAINEMVDSVARTAIYSGEPILGKKLINPGDKGVMAALLKPGMRAVTTRISVDTAAGGFIQPGDRVDIILTADVPLNPATQQFQVQTQQSISTTVFENVHILAIDQTYAAGPNGGAAVVGSTATFEMTQSDAELLQEIESQGDLTLTLRGINDARARPGTSAATVERTDDQSVATITTYRAGQPQVTALKGN